MAGNLGQGWPARPSFCGEEGDQIAGACPNGIAIVTMAKGGLMYEASVGGQKFSYKAIGKTSIGTTAR